MAIIAVRKKRVFFKSVCSPCQVTHTVDGNTNLTLRNLEEKTEDTKLIGRKEGWDVIFEEM